MAIARVATRVLQGGHHIPETVIRRRFQAGKDNLELYKNIVNSWIVFDSRGTSPLLLEYGVNNEK